MISCIREYGSFLGPHCPSICVCIKLILSSLISNSSCVPHVAGKKSNEDVECVRNVPPLLSNPYFPFRTQYKAKAIYINRESELQKY